MRFAWRDDTWFGNSANKHQLLTPRIRVDGNHILVLMLLLTKVFLSFLQHCSTSDPKLPDKMPSDSVEWEQKPRATGKRNTPRLKPLR